MGSSFSCHNNRRKSKLSLSDIPKSSNQVFSPQGPNSSLNLDAYGNNPKEN